ncbi:hypothetical protein T265_10577 [Opisthorchis viverrini]|uniref:Uncharacterized protein n=1 Tax=Opisthorchis viverrini TaxID=6198 RepID=A0A075A0Q9_OPIVI|nr:hypothetical protein T265_10577 [Opisthorchis viverrini]KER20999.1 hypothetical protein T265_10577 [Opisthorchis viverrini]
MWLQRPWCTLPDAVPWSIPFADGMSVRAGKNFARSDKLTADEEPSAANVQPSMASEVYDRVCALRHHRASGPDDRPPALF